MKVILETPPIYADLEDFQWKNFFNQIFTFSKAEADVVSIQTTNYLLSDAMLYPVDTTAGIVTGTLPAAGGSKGKKYIVKWTAGGNACKVSPAGTDTIDGGGVFTLVAVGDSAFFISDGATNWYRIIPK